MFLAYRAFARCRFALPGRRGQALRGQRRTPSLGAGVGGSSASRTNRWSEPVSRRRTARRQKAGRRVMAGGFFPPKRARPRRGLLRACPGRPAMGAVLSVAGLRMGHHPLDRSTRGQNFRRAAPVHGLVQFVVLEGRGRAGARDRLLLSGVALMPSWDGRATSLLLSLRRRARGLGS